MDSLRERLEALQSYVETLDAAVTHNTSESLLEWHLRRLALDLEVLKTEALITLAEGRKTDVSFSGVPVGEAAGYSAGTTWKFIDREPRAT